MTHQHPAIRILERSYEEGRLTRREFVAGLGTAMGLLAIGGSTTDVIAAAERHAERIDVRATPKRGGTLKVAITGQPDQLDPGTDNTYASFQIMANVFDTLVSMTGKGHFAPNLATKWRQLDHKTWEFDLVHNAVFHNGQPFTSKDVAYTINRILDPKTGSPESTSFDAIKQAQVVDKYTVRLHLKYPYGPLLSNLANGAYIVNQKAVTTLDPRRHPIGTGPFKFKEWVTNDHVTLVRNPKYWATGLPYLDSVVFHGAPVDETRMAALKTGEFNWIDAVPLNDIKSLRKSRNPVLLQGTNGGNPDFLGLVVDTPPFNNKKLRQAVAWAIDKKAILDVAYFGDGQRGSQEVGTHSPLYTSNDPYKNGPNLNKAQSLLKQSGLGSVTFEYLGLPQYPELLKTGEIVKEQLSQIGITMNITQLEVTVWIQRLIKRQYQMTSIYAAGTVDPDPFYSSELTSTGADNFTGYKNPKVDALVTQARQTSSVSKRRALYGQIRSHIWDDCPYIFVHLEVLNYAFAPKVHGTTILPNFQLSFKNVWIG
jgi:peptide/nickel transport system substrate-binding protein